MLIIGFNKIGKTYIANKYSDKIIELDSNNYISTENWPINYIEAIKTSLLEKEIVICTYQEDLILCLDALNIDYTLVYPDLECKDDYIEYWDKYDIFENSNKSKIILQKQENLEQALSVLYDWIKLDVIEESKQDIIPQNKNKLTMTQLLNDDLEITENDVRDLKATQNKLKVGMLLQAKSSLNRILKLSNTLDKLYDKLLDRIDNSLDNTDTASLMYTTEYIAKALNDTNQFILSLINNEKIQNFFIIDNTNVINVNDSSINIDERERIRKAVEIVMNNIDYFEQGQFNELKNPNIIEVSEESINANNEP